VFENRELAKKYGVIALPVLVMLENGREVGRLKGLKSKKEIKAFLEGYK
jgi:thioredoxin-like negative regulator of GroEL